jgi:RNA polymerase sigma-70 factor, ECF subfamily
VAVGGNFERTLEAAQRGDEEAFAAIWRRFQPGLLRYLKVRAAPVAEDLAADIWMRIIGALPAFEGDDQRFRAWLYTTARNRATDWYRSGHQRVEYIEHSRLTAMPATTDVEFEVEQRSATDVAIALIGRLPKDQAEAVMLRVVAGLDVPRVASMMGRSSGSVRVLCHRGLRLLERLLQEDQPATVADRLAGVVPSSAPSTLESA